MRAGAKGVGRSGAHADGWGGAEANREIGVPGECRNGKMKKSEFWLSADNKGFRGFGVRKCGFQWGYKSRILILICKC
jgi:hypothetical protein